MMIPLHLGARADLLRPSETMAITARAAALRRQGVDVIGLAAGEPDFPTPEHVRRAATEAQDRGETRYTSAAGIPELRVAAARMFSNLTGTSYDARQVIVTCGAKQACFNSMFVLLDPGDPVVIPAPCWVTYPAQVALCGGVPRIVPPARGGTIDLDGIEQAAPGARALILCNPSNPTGQLLGADALRRIGDIARDHNLVVLIDEIYSDLVYGPEPFTAFLRACPDLVDRTIAVHGVSKSYAMTGWRIGFCACPPSMAKKIGALMSQSTSNPCSISQWAALAALEGPQSFLEEWRGAFRRRRDKVVEGLQAIDGVRCPTPGGAFYVFPDVRALIQRAGLRDDMALAERLIEDARVAPVPGTPFHAPGYLRISYAVSEEDLDAALERIGDWVARL